MQIAASGWTIRSGIYLSQIPLQQSKPTFLTIKLFGQWLDESEWDRPQIPLQ